MSVCNSECCPRCGCISPVHEGWCGEISELRELLERSADAIQEAIQDRTLIAEIRKKLKD